jgi:hypothetical protein
VGVVAHEQLSANCKVAQLTGMNNGPKKNHCPSPTPATQSELPLSFLQRSASVLSISLYLLLRGVMLHAMKQLTC